MTYTNSRNPHHNYRSKSAYLVTLKKRPGVADFSTLMGTRSNPARMPGVKYSHIGWAIINALMKIPEGLAHCQILQYIIMPDHIHFVVNIREDVDYHLGDLVNALKREVFHTLKAEGSLAPDATLGVFEDGYHDRIKIRAEQLRFMIDYVKDNPRRLVIKREHPEFFGRALAVEIQEESLMLYGNFLLLSNPCRSAVRVSSKFSAEELEQRNREWDETIRSNGVLVSPFISPKEKEIKEKGLANGASLILITREKIGERFKPPGQLFDLCAAGRLLIVSTQKAAFLPRLSREEALAMNALAKKLASTAPPSLA